MIMQVLWFLAKFYKFSDIPIEFFLAKERSLSNVVSRVLMSFQGNCFLYDVCITVSLNDT
jgi:hypothetical protein